ncbi:hypothetical protein MtrunA17_Chr8g0359631 [Medicago truncatula]|uniref:Uncharacterized protein n=1 Tax=Medicago truncatula TaxID=3880 RepID=A0A396GIN9_MEDTR|nr:hypothetical protein MtrunA17_Chr8g0359631 [Medicago truncatula]
MLPSSSPSVTSSISGWKQFCSEALICGFFSWFLEPFFIILSSPSSPTPVSPPSSMAAPTLVVLSLLQPSLIDAAVPGSIPDDSQFSACFLLSP